MDLSTTAWLNIAFGFGVLFSGLILFLASTYLPESIQGGKTWAYGNFTMFLGLILLGLRSMVPEFIPVLVGNALLLGATLFFFQAFNKLMGENKPVTPGYIFTALTIIGMAYFLFVTDDYGMRLIIFSIGMIATTGMSFALIFPMIKNEPNIIPRIIAIIYIANFLMFLDRIVIGLSNRDQGMVFFENNPHILISLIVLTAIVMTMTFTFVLLSNTKNYLKIHKLAYLDELTQTFSRRAILDHGRSSINLSNRSQIPFSVLLIDMDDLKLINDRHGHMAGDQALKRIAAIIKNNLREEDAIGRYGGDEFIVILRNTNLKGAEHTTLRLIGEIDKANMVETIKVTVSIGICQYNPSGCTFNDILHKADQALYLAKQTGENSYHIAECE